MAVFFKKHILLLSFIALSLSIYGQTQQGQVKTLGRPNQPGKPLQDVTIRVQGLHNAVVSTAEGRFSFALQGKKEGDSYQLLSVQKNGYELNEQGMVGRSIAFSSRVPLTLVMVSLQQLQADKQRIENNSYAVAERNYKQQIELLEQQNKSDELSTEEYRKKLSDLQDSFNRYQFLIDELSDHYAHVDYDSLTVQEREINVAIENGELEQAEQLLQQVFDPIEAIKRGKESLEKIRQAEEQAQVALNKARADLQAVMRQQEKDAEHLYQLYTIALARFDNEKARFYIEARAELDTTNVQWQNEAGDFITEIIGDYDEALIYFNRSLQMIENSRQFEMKASVQISIGAIYELRGKYSEAIEYNQKALEQANHFNNRLDVGVAYNNMGNCYRYMGKYDDAEMNFKQAIASYEQVTIEDIAKRHLRRSKDDLIATALINLCKVYEIKGDYQRCKDLAMKALDIFITNHGEMHQSVASAYSQLGSVYCALGNNSEGLKYFEKAVTIWIKVYGEHHPFVAIAYNNIGSTLSDMNENMRALTYHQKALETKLAVYGEMHLSTATTYMNISAVYNGLEKYKEAMTIMEKALEIKKTCITEGNTDLAMTYFNMGMCYNNYIVTSGDASKQSLARQCIRKAYEIITKLLPANHPYVQAIKEELADE